MLTSNEKHKDRLFKFVFGNPEHKEWTLSLYNALNDSHYTNPEDIEFNTIEDAVYMGMKNDVSFIVAFTISIWEHQSTYNPNIPLRILMYLVHLLEKYLVSREAYVYGRKLVRIPEPKCVCFYNGTEEQPEETILKLSDAFMTENSNADLELKVRMLNVNYGRNRKLMEACSAMNEYANLIGGIRRHRNMKGNLEAAIDAAIDEMPDSFELKKFLVGHRAEVKGMIIAEWDAEKAYQYAQKEARTEEKERVASDMLKDNYPLSAIQKISRLPEEAIRNLASSLGITVA